MRVLNNPTIGGQVDSPQMIRDKWREVPYSELREVVTGKIIESVDEKDFLVGIATIKFLDGSEMRWEAGRLKSLYVYVRDAR